MKGVEILSTLTIKSRVHTKDYSSLLYKYIPYCMSFVSVTMIFKINYNPGYHYCITDSWIIPVFIVLFDFIYGIIYMLSLWYTILPTYPLDLNPIFPFLRLNRILRVPSEMSCVLS